MLEWNKRGDAATVEDYVRNIIRTTGVNADDILNPVMENPQNIDGLYEAAEYLVHAIRGKKTITIVGDYDSDGLNATAILCKLCRYYSVTPRAIIPGRMTDGYGLSKRITDSISEGLVITIDNGISAKEEIATLKAKGCQVAVLDHHLLTGDIPPADVVVDPHVNNSKGCFEDYCGAGLGLQLARLMLSQDKTRAGDTLLKELTIHAAIATITDIMPLIGPNRRIVIDGLMLLNDPGIATACPGLSAIRLAAKAERINEETLGFSLGPLLNAPARLYDKGGVSVLKTLVCEDFTTASGYANKMREINEQRKTLARDFAQKAESQIREMNPDPGHPIALCLDGACEGLLGIIAGHLVTKYHRPAFVFTKPTGKPDVYKGSGRTYGGFDITPILDSVRDMTESCGGHTGAAGLVVSKANIQNVLEAIRGFDMPTDDVETQGYDIVAPLQELTYFEQEQTRFAPFGEGCRKPVYLVRNVPMVSSKGEPKYRYIGANQDTIKFTACGVEFIGFGLAEKYNGLYCPPTCDILCTLGQHTFNGLTSIQATIVDMR